MRENDHNCECSVCSDRYVTAMTFQQVVDDSNKMRAAGLRLSEAAMHVIREYDGVHRLSMAVAEWVKVVADEGGRDKRYTAFSSEQEK